LYVNQPQGWVNGENCLGRMKFLGQGKEMETRLISGRVSI